jgi:hypothetical protein
MPPKTRRKSIGRKPKRRGEGKRKRDANEQSNEQSNDQSNEQSVPADDLLSDDSDDDYSYQSESDQLLSEEERTKIRRKELKAVTSTTMRRNAIAYYYLMMLEAPPKDKWDGKGGTVSLLSTHLGIPSGSGKLVRNVLLDVEFALITGAEYDGTVDRSNVGRPASVSQKSYELQIIADAIEGGQGITGATLLVNEHRAEDGKEPLGRSAVYNASLSLSPKIIEIKSMSQGQSSCRCSTSNVRLLWKGYNNN